MSISIEQVYYISQLSRLSLSEAQLCNYSKKLEQVLHYVDKLNEIDLASHIIQAPSTQELLREDHVSHDLNKEECFQNAPDIEGDFFKVPQILSNEV